MAMRKRRGMGKRGEGNKEGKGKEKVNGEVEGKGEDEVKRGGTKISRNYIYETTERCVACVAVPGAAKEARRSRSPPTPMAVVLSET